jgi:hypothetical protein
MGLTMLVVLVLAAVLAVLALDLLGVGWAIRRLWRNARVQRFIQGKKRER